MTRKPRTPRAVRLGLHVLHQAFCDLEDLPRIVVRCETLFIIDIRDWEHLGHVHACEPLRIIRDDRLVPIAVVVVALLGLVALLGWSTSQVSAEESN